MTQGSHQWPASWKVLSSLCASVEDFDQNTTKTLLSHVSRMGFDLYEGPHVILMPGKDVVPTRYCCVQLQQKEGKLE